MSLNKHNLLVLRKGNTSLVVIPWQSGQSQPSYSAKQITLSHLQTTGRLLDYYQRKYWIVLQGRARVNVNGDSLEQERLVVEHQAILLPQLALHSIHNVGYSDLVFIEFRTRHILTGREVVEFNR